VQGSKYLSKSYVLPCICVEDYHKLAAKIQFLSSLPRQSATEAYGGGELGTGNVVSDTLNLPSLSTALRGGPLKKLWRGAKIKIEQGKQKEKKIVHQKR
jgi:hypothetical protein